MDENTSQQNSDKIKNCSFCNIPREGVVTVIVGDNACICPNCVLGVHKMLVEKTDIRSQIKTKFDISITKSLTLNITVLSIGIIATLVLFFYYSQK